MALHCCQWVWWIVAVVAAGGDGVVVVVVTAVWEIRMLLIGVGIEKGKDG